MRTADSIVRSVSLSSGIHNSLVGFAFYRSSLLICLFCNFVSSLCSETRGPSNCTLSSRVETKRLGGENGLSNFLRRHIFEGCLSGTRTWNNRASQSQDGKKNNGQCFRTSITRSSKQASHSFNCLLGVIAVKTKRYCFFIAF